MPSYMNYSDGGKTRFFQNPVLGSYPELNMNYPGNCRFFLNTPLPSIQGSTEGRSFLPFGFGFGGRRFQAEAFGRRLRLHYLHNSQTLQTKCSYVQFNFALSKFRNNLQSFILCLHFKEIENFIKRNKMKLQLGVNSDLIKYNL